MNDNNTIECRKCKYYYITWDEKFPYGCRAMGFKGKMQPSIVVKKNSGTKCMMFRKKKTPEDANQNK